MTKDRFRAKPNTKYIPKGLKALIEREDDQIAPKAAAHSTDALQRWALHTANISHGSYKPNETQTVERIRDRYVDGAFSLSSHEEVDQDPTPARSDRTTQDAASKKRKHTISPTGSLRLNAVNLMDASDAGVQKAKRRKSRPLEASSLSEDDDYAQSSEWNFPGEDEDVITKTIAKEDKHTRTYIYID